MLTKRFFGLLGVTTFGVASMPVSAHAHPGHGNADGSPAHYLLSWEHAVPMVIVCFIAAMIALGVRIAIARPRTS